MHATESVQKEVERLIHCSHRHGPPRLDPEVDASIVQLVGYWTTREEIGDLFHQVYSLKRLPCARGHKAHFVFLERQPKVEER